MEQQAARYNSEQTLPTPSRRWGWQRRGFRRSMRGSRSTRKMRWPRTTAETCVLRVAREQLGEGLGGLACLYRKVGEYLGV
jgi:hypothetical protein